MYHSMLSSVRKAVQNLPGRIIKKQEETESWEAEVNPHKKDILRYRSLMNEEGIEDSDKIDCIRRIGHNAYTGGPEAAKCAGETIPFLLGILLGENSTLKVQVLRSLSEICHGNKENQETLRRNNGLHAILICIGDTTNIRLSRWACYLLYIITANNIPMMRAVSDMPNAWETLNLAAIFPRSWSGWPCNFATELLSLLGLESNESSLQEERNTCLPIRIPKLLSNGAPILEESL